MKALGAAVGSVRTPEQSQIAIFWADGAGTETPPGHWNTIARGVAQQTGNSLTENAPLRPAQPGAGGCGCLRLGREVRLQRLAADHGHPQRGSRRQLRNDRRPGLELVPPDAAVPRLCVGAQHVQRCGCHGAGPVLRYGPCALHDRQRLAAGCRAVVPGILGGRRGGEPTRTACAAAATSASGPPSDSYGLDGAAAVGETTTDATTTAMVEAGRASGTPTTGKPAGRNAGRTGAVVSPKSIGTTIRHRVQAVRSLDVLVAHLLEHDQAPRPSGCLEWPDGPRLARPDAQQRAGPRPLRMDQAVAMQHTMCCS